MRRHGAIRALKSIEAAPDGLVTLLRAVTFPVPRRVRVDDSDGMRKVLLASPAALAAGVMPGQSVNAALALLPELQLEQRDTDCEQRCLRQLGQIE